MGERFSLDPLSSLVLEFGSHLACQTEVDSTERIWLQQEVPGSLKVSFLNRWENRTMKNCDRSLGWLVSVLMVGLVMLWGCDSGEKALDEVTGNRAVKQYHKSKKDLEKVADRQSERLKGIPDDGKEEGKTE